MQKQTVEAYIEENKFKINEIDSIFNNYSNIDKILNKIEEGNGYITTKQVDMMGIGRDYLKKMLKANLIEKIDRGIYMHKNHIEDSYYLFQLKYKKTIFSHMTALYFYGLTEMFPSVFNVTVDYNYHVEKINKDHMVFKRNKNIMDIGITNVSTQFGNIVRTYDIERCICDIIKDKNRLDLEQIKKSVKMYVKSDKKDNTKLSIYAKKLGIYNEVMNFVGMFYE